YFLYFRCRCLHSFAFFPYTTLFRSTTCRLDFVEMFAFFETHFFQDCQQTIESGGACCRSMCGMKYSLPFKQPKKLTNCYNFVFRSEEHTSELQSRENLVCRLLLEKK